VSCNTKFNKAGQEGTLSRSDRLNIIHAVSKRTRDQDVALTETASSLRRRSPTVRIGVPAEAIWTARRSSGSRAPCGQPFVPLRQHRQVHQSSWATLLATDCRSKDNAHGIPLGRSADTDNQTLVERENDANVFLFVFVVAASSQ